MVPVQTATHGMDSAQCPITSLATALKQGPVPWQVNDQQAGEKKYTLTIRFRSQEFAMRTQTKPESC